MKFVLVVGFLVGFGLNAYSADVCIDTVCQGTTTDQNVAANKLKTAHNAALCEAIDLPYDCTQAQYDAAGGVGTIYPANGNGTKQFILDRVFVQLIDPFVDVAEGVKLADAVIAWKQASNAQRESACLALGKTAECK
jgi:hypothetical protein